MAQAEASPQTGALLRWIAFGCIAGAVLLILWMIALAGSLSSDVTARHWSTAWVGLDVMESAGFAATGLLLLRRDSRVSITASATAALLVADGWFDMTTAPQQWGYLEAFALAWLLEFPLAAVCLWVAVRAPRWAGETASG